MTVSRPRAVFDHLVRVDLARRRSAAGRTNVLRLQSLLSLLDIELDLVTLGERLEAFPRDCRVMHEDVVSTLLGDESVAPCRR